VEQGDPGGVQQAVDEAAAVELEFDVLRPDDLQPRRGAAVGIVAPYWALPRPQDVIATGKRRPAFVVAAHHAALSGPQLTWSSISTPPADTHCSVRSKMNRTTGRKRTARPGA
jgi:hypothetical protein